MVQSAVAPTKRLSLSKYGILVLQEGAADTRFHVRVKTPVILQRDGFSSQIAKVVVESIPVLATQQEKFSINGTTGKKVAIDKGASNVASRTVINFADGSGAMEFSGVAGALRRMGDGDYPADKDVVVRVAGEPVAAPEVLVTGAALATGPAYTARIINAAGQFPLVPGSVKINYTVGVVGVLMDLWGDGRLVGRHGFGTVNYETGEVTILLSANSTADITAEYEYVDNVAAFANSAADVEANYEQLVQSLSK